jgi:hypothetical protein
MPDTSANDRRWNSSTNDFSNPGFTRNEDDLALPG